MLRFIDTHTHFYDEAFAQDAEAAIGRAREAGVFKMIQPDVDSRERQALFDLTARYPGELYPMLGLYPGSVDAGWEKEVEALEGWLDRNPVAIGEIGRPHFECSEEIWDASNRILQRGMEIARENDVPVIIHCESGTTDTNRSLADIARKAGLDPGLVIKHSSPPFVTEEETFGVLPSIPASKTNIKTALSKGTDRFMLETDYIDDPEKPSAIMAVTTVPNKVKWMLASGTADEDVICRICRDLPDRMYHR